MVSKFQFEGGHKSGYGDRKGQKYFYLYSLV